MERVHRGLLTILIAGEGRVKVLIVGSKTKGMDRNAAAIASTKMNLNASLLVMQD